MSAAERDKHLKLMHRDASDNKRKIDIEHKCLYIIKENKSARRCNLVFKSGYELLAHKKANWAHPWKKKENSQYRVYWNCISEKSKKIEIAKMKSTPRETPECRMGGKEKLNLEKWGGGGRRGSREKIEGGFICRPIQ